MKASIHCPKEMFLETVEVDGQQVPRIEYIGVDR
jgi:hypothetical protein